MEKENRSVVLLFFVANSCKECQRFFVAQLIFAEVWAYRDFLLNFALTNLHG